DAERPAAHLADRLRRRQGAAGLLPAGETPDRRLGAHVGRAQPDQWIGRLHLARGHAGLRRTAAGSEHVPEGFRGALLRLVKRAGDAMDPREKVVPLAALTTGRPP